MPKLEKKITTMSKENKAHLQSVIEQKMHDDGVSRYRRRFKGIKGKAETANVVGRKLLASTVDVLDAGIQAWYERELKREEEYSHGKPRKGAAVFSIFKKAEKVVGTKLMSALTCRTILDGISVSKKATRISMVLASAIEKEYVLNNIQADAPRWFAHYKNSLGTPAVCKDKSTLIYRQKRLKDYLENSEKDRDWSPWSSEMKIQLGTLLAELFCQVTGIAHIENRKDIRGKRHAYITPSPGTLEALDSWHECAEILKPIYKPCLVEPKDWTNPYDGGYFSKQLYKNPLVKTGDIEYLKTLQETNMPEVYNAVNKLQKTSWQINKDILSIMEEFWETGHDGAGLPSRRDEEIPEKPSDIETNEEARDAWRRTARDVHDHNDKQRSKRLGLLQTLVLADEYKDVEEFFYVWQLDWRGRLYPISYFYLQPQGPDFGRALIRFKNGKPLSTDSSVKWFKVHGSNCWGNSKLSLDDRIQWVDDNEELILNFASDPFYYSDWMESDEPWCFLAWCLEYAEWKQDPENFISRLAVAQDATQSGLQILSLLALDKTGAEQTNLIDCDKPVDLYQSVADCTTALLEEAKATTDEEIKLDVKRLKDNYKRLKERREKKGKPFDEDKELQKLHSSVAAARRIREDAALWLDLGVDRGMCKRPVMTKVYNASNHSMVKYLKESAIEKGLQVEKQHIFKACSFLAKYVQKAIAIKLEGAQDMMDYLGEVANTAVEANSPIWWYTPAGMPIMQKYTKINSKTVSTCIDGKIRTRSITEDTNEINPRKQKQAFSPNLVHSLDAALLMLTVNKMEECDSFAMVHDSFGVLAADAEDMAKAIRRSYYDVFSKEVLKDILADIDAHLEEEHKGKLPEVPAMGELNVNDLLASKFMFS